MTRQLNMPQKKLVSKKKRGLKSIVCFLKRTTGVQSKAVVHIHWPVGNRLKCFLEGSLGEDVWMSDIDTADELGYPQVCMFEFEIDRRDKVC